MLMKRYMGTLVLFILLILTVAAILKLGAPADTNALVHQNAAATHPKR